MCLICLLMCPSHAIDYIFISYEGKSLVNDLPFTFQERPCGFRKTVYPIAHVLPKSIVSIYPASIPVRCRAVKCSISACISTKTCNLLGQFNKPYFQFLFQYWLDSVEYKFNNRYWLNIGENKWLIIGLDLEDCGEI